MKTHEINDTKVSAIGDYIPSILGLESGEKILYTVVTKDYSGNMLFSFENGKMAKVPLSAYETKSNRKKLIGAYSDKAKIADIKWIQEDCDIVAFADNNKVICVNTEKIALKTTKSTQGVQVMKLTKKGAKLFKVLLAKESDIENLKKYTTKNIPAAGSFLTKGDGESKQVSLFE